MKRTLSGDLSPNPSPTSSNNGATNNRNQNQQQQTDANRQRAPAMQAPAANDPARENPLFAGNDENRPDWEEFAYQLSHTPPVTALQNDETDQVSALSEDASFGEELADDSSCSSAPDSPLAIQICRNADDVIDKVEITHLEIREISRLIEVCKSDTVIKHLKISHKPSRKINNPEEVLRKLTEFFTNTINIQKFEFCFYSDQLKIDAPFLNAVLGNRGLRDLAIYVSRQVVINKEELKSIKETITKNSTLKSLTIIRDKSQSTVRALIEGISENSALESFEILAEFYPGFGQSIATLLKQNHTLKKLKIQNLGDPEEPKLTELAIALEGIAQNNTLEVLEISEVMYLNPWEISEKMLKPVSQNHGLKTLILPDAKPLSGAALKLLGDLMQNHPTLNSFHLGHLPRKKKHQPAFLDALRPNPRIQHLFVSWGLFTKTDTNDNSDFDSFSREFFKKLGEFSGLTSVKFKFMPIDDHLINFIKTHPKIHFFLTSTGDQVNQTRQKDLLDLVRSSSHIKKVKFVDSENIGSEESIFRNDLARALATAQEVTSDKKIAEASVAMKALLDKKSMTDEELPFVPLDVTDELTKAIARHLPSAKAKAIFDELILHAPKPQ